MYVHTCRFTSCPCSATVGAYGGQDGTPFVDNSEHPCDVEITNIWVRSGEIVDSIQVYYRLPDGQSKPMPRRGGATGGANDINVPQDGKIIGITGGVTSYYGRGTVITQLRVVILDGKNNVHIYGPYGTLMNAGSSTFAVYGDIKSLFGYHRKYLEGLGAYYESWGDCDSPCN